MKTRSRESAPKRKRGPARKRKRDLLFDEKRREVAFLAYMNRLLAHKRNELLALGCQPNEVNCELQKREREIADLGRKWTAVGLSLLHVNFSLANDVWDAQDALRESLQAIMPNASFDHPKQLRERRRHIDHDLRVLRNLVDHIAKAEGRLKSEFAKTAFGPLLAKWKQDLPAVQGAALERYDHLRQALHPETVRQWTERPGQTLSVISTDPSHPGQGLVAAVGSVRGVRLYANRQRKSTMEEVVEEAALSLHKVLCKRSHQCPLDAIATLISKTIRLLEIPFAHRTATQAALRERFRRLFKIAHS